MNAERKEQVRKKLMEGLKEELRGDYECWIDLCSIVNFICDQLSQAEKDVLGRIEIDEREYRMIEGQWKLEAGRMDKVHIPLHEYLNLPENLKRILRVREGN